MSIDIKKGYTFIVWVLVVVAWVVVFLACRDSGVHSERKRWEAIYGPFQNHRPAPEEWQFQDRMVMTISVGMDKTAIITDVRLMDGDKRIRELELRGDTCMANSVKGLPQESGVWECLVEEWASARFREFRVTESRRVI